ncbi:MAG: hypothetical protein II464_07265 [Oscillospiraceae bacterium]|nr:hypothetical protein [Oscillospiraceae bacterium]
MFRRENKVILEVTAAELRIILASLLALRNKLLSEGRYTDPIDEMLLKLMISFLLNQVRLQLTSIPGAKS